MVCHLNVYEYVTREIVYVEIILYVGDINKYRPTPVIFRLSKQITVLFICY